MKSNLSLLKSSFISNENHLVFAQHSQSKPTAHLPVQSMGTRSKALLKAVFAGMLFAGAALTSAQTYTITDLGTLPSPYNVSSQATGVNDSGQVVGISSGASSPHAFLYSKSAGMQDLGTLQNDTFSQATGVNSSGQAAGYSYGAYTPSHAFLYSNGTLQDLGTLGGTYSFGYAINDSGEVVGNAYTAANADHAFLYSNGGMHDLGTLPGGTYSFAHGINRSGQIAGSSTISDGTSRAFLYSNGVMQNLGVLPNGYNSEAEGLNNAGQVVGSSYVNGIGGIAFLYSNGSMQSLGVLPGYNQSDATAINNQGQVVGWSCTTSQCHASLYSGGKLTDLNTLLPAGSGWTLTVAYGINDAGQIIGSGTNPQGQGHAFLLSPVPTTYVVAIRTSNNHYVTAVNGGGLGGGNTALYTNAVAPGPFETFTMDWVNQGQGLFALKTANGDFVTAVNGGGIGGPNNNTAPVHTDATSLGSWEKYVITVQPNGTATVRTCDGYYVTAVNGGGFGGPNNVPIHTNATSLGAWEKFTMQSTTCP